MMSTKRSRHLVSTSFDMTCDAYMGVCNDHLLRIYLPYELSWPSLFLARVVHG